MIRMDFVSNSSSCSFCLVGNCLSEDELRQKLNIPEEESVYDFIDEKFDKEDIRLNYHRGISDDNLWYFGLFYDNMMHEETRIDFENRIKSTLTDLFGSSDQIECFIDGGYDG